LIETVLQIKIDIIKKTKKKFYMPKIPFKVSARTARLIGRENIASSKGAIIELVKNGYDADSPLSLIYFNREKDVIYIIDAGEGMTQKIIEDYWMTIGTNNKAEDYFTKTGRVKAGAKGIGRFALDKLGDRCEMTTKFDSNKHKSDDGNVAYIWKVNWKEFDDADTKVIGEIEADLEAKEIFDLKQYILNEIDDTRVQEVINRYDFTHGTVLKITELRDNWEDFYVSQVFDDLEVLVPPKEESGFQLFLFSKDEESKYGEILGSVCDDYDYKIVAKADNSQNIHITIYRNEYDVDTIPIEFFNRKNMQEENYTREVFRKGFWTTQRKFSELIPGFKDIDKDNIFEKIGEFSFTFYYMKRTYSTPDLEKFYYNKFNPQDRQFWLNKFGGIKLFRDDFRVRPYGEVKDSAFDWLGLGGRKSKNPAPTSHPSGKWKTEPDNISGMIKISRVDNIDFKDKSSREGLQENKTFQIFKQLLIGILEIFEKDRAKIAREMFLFYEEIHKDKISDKEIEKITKKILSNTTKNKEQTQEDKEKVVLAKTVQTKQQKIEELEDEQKILRGMATSGIVTASFTHELSNLSGVLANRVEKLKKLFEEKAPPKSFNSVPNFLNPYRLLEHMKNQDNKLQNWLRFSLESAKKDKRKRKKIYLEKYFEGFFNSWQTILEGREIEFKYQVDKTIDMRAEEIDLDSIFNNLVVNSIDSFMRQKSNTDRKINIEVKTTNKEIIIDYFDNGEGLSKDIKEHQQIFQALYTTKRNEHTGEEIGTGLGMWLIDTIVREYNGKITLLYPKDSGFGIRIVFIRRYLKEKNG
jgi:signal transduction histidine kinase